MSWGLRSKALMSAALLGVGMTMVVLASAFFERSRSEMTGGGSSVSMLDLDKSSKKDLELALELAVNRQKFEAQRAIVQKYDNEINSVFQQLKVEVRKKREAKDELLRLGRAIGSEEHSEENPVLDPVAAPSSSLSSTTSDKQSANDVEASSKPASDGRAAGHMPAVQRSEESKPAAVSVESAEAMAKNKADVEDEGVVGGISDLLRSVKDSTSFIKTLSSLGDSAQSQAPTADLPATLPATVKKKDSLHEMKQFAKVVRTLEQRRVPGSEKLPTRGAETLKQEPAEKEASGDEQARAEMEATVIQDDQDETLP